MATNTEIINVTNVSSKTKTKNIKKLPDDVFIENDDKSEVKNKYEIFWDNHGNGKPSQTERYEKQNSPEYILRFIRIGGGPKMGTTLESYARFAYEKEIKEKIQAMIIK
jgi:hypothetical protein